MSCVYEHQPVSVSCILEVVNDIRIGAVSTTTIRKALKQVDAGLALFGKPNGDVITLSDDLILLAHQLEESVKEDQLSVNSGLWLTILIAILRALMAQ